MKSLISVLAVSLLSSPLAAQNFCAADAWSTLFWNQKTGSWQSTSTGGTLLYPSGGNIFVTDSSSHRVWNYRTSAWTSNSISSTLWTASATQGNYSVYYNTSNKAVAYNARTSKWTTVSGLSGFFAIHPSHGNFAVQCTGTVAIFNKQTDAWTTLQVTGMQGVIASGGNFLVITTGTVYAWNQWTSGWASMNYSTRHSVDFSDGNFMLYHTGGASAWNKETSTWHTESSVSGVQSTKASDGNFALYYIASTQRHTYAWNSTDSTWYQSALHDATATLLESKGNFFVAGGSKAHVFDAKTSQWSNVTYSGSIKNYGGSKGYFVARWYQGIAAAWDKESGQWATTSGTGRVYQTLGSRGNFGLRQSGKVALWNSKTKLWDNTTFSGAGMLYADDGNFILSRSGGVDAWSRYTQGSTGWSSHATGTVFQFYANSGFPAVRVSGIPQKMEVFNPITGQWTSTSTDSTWAVLKSAGNYMINKNGVVKIWDQTTSSWSSTQINGMTQATTSLGNFFVIAGLNAHVWNRATSNWTSYPTPSPLYVPSTIEAQFSLFGVGCPTPSGTPDLRAPTTAKPKIGSTFKVTISGIPAGWVANGVYGLSRTLWNTTPLPLDLGFMGLNGCFLYVSIDYETPLQVANGKSTWSTPIPNDLSLLGLDFYLQAWMFDPVSGNGAVTNAGEGTITSK